MTSSTAPRALDETPPRSVLRVPGEPGIWVVIFGDLLAFVVLFAIRLYSRAQDPQMAAESQRHLNSGLGLLNTLILLVSSVLVVGATRSVRTPNRERPVCASYLFAGAAACGVLFSVIKVVEYHDKVSSAVTPMTNDFFLYYFMITGFHWVHVIIGVAVLVALAVSSRPPALSPRSVGYIESGACFWHMVDLLWLIIFPLVYLVR